MSKLIYFITIIYFLFPEEIFNTLSIKKVYIFPMTYHQVAICGNSEKKTQMLLKRLK